MPLNPHCPLCSGKIELKERDFEYVVCPHCEVSFAGFELFDSLPDLESSGRILPFGVLASKELKLDTMRKLLKNMELLFELVASGQAQGIAISEEHLTAYLISLIEGQWQELEGKMPGSWALVPHDKIDKNLHDEFIHFPTYLAVGTLAFALHEMPWLTGEVPTLKRSLQRGLDFATHRGLAGRGYQWLEWRQRIFSIFERGKVLDLLLEQPDISPRMCFVLGYIHQRTAEILTRTEGPIEYETRGPVSRDIYERIARQTAAFEHFCIDEHVSLA